MKRRYIIIIIILMLLIGFILYYTKKQNDLMIKDASKYSKNIDKSFGKNKVDSNYNLKNSYYINYPDVKNKILNEKIIKIKREIKKQFKQKISFKNLTNKKNYKLVTYNLYFAPDNNFSITFFQYNIKNNKKTIDDIYTYNFNISSKEKLKDTYIFRGDYKTIITNYLNKYFENEEHNKQYEKYIGVKANYKYVITNDGLIVYFNGKNILKNNNKLIKVLIPYSELNTVLNFNPDNETEKYEPKVNSKKEKYQDSVKDMYVKKITNVYKDGDKNSNLVGTLEKGNLVNVVKSSDSFAYIDNNDIKGYILNEYLSDDVVALASFIDTDETVYATEKINISSEKGSTDNILVTLNKGDSIKRIGTSDDGFSEVVYNNKPGFVKSNLLSLSKPVKNITIDKNHNVNPQKGMVALTFDDGPNPSSTNRILDTLSKYNAVATFFDLGKLATIYPNVVKREVALGCEVGSHTYNHANLNTLTASQIQEEVEKSRNAFISVLGEDIKILRPPYGNANATVQANIPYPIINWNIDTLDWKSRNKDAILKELRVTDNFDGKIILMHSIYQSTADAVEVIVPELINKGYQLVTISEMAYYKGVSLKPGTRYYSF